ncbi:MULTISPECIES: hypothetical protein [unclassified Roseovarius]|uniref:hypothetical protein n=1 Tax=unclassified Roseovarius TaxID=2614913 RepID=UPI00273F24F1|nr:MULTISPECIES: hypothetical protein [unclassified Roseovarius]
MHEPSPDRTIAPRDPAVVMRLDRLGSFHQSRLSFIRVLLRRLKAQDWTFERARFDINDLGVGHAVYTAHGPERSYSLVAFANDLPPEKRSDRVIATEWDATFTLFDGIPDEADIERLSRNVPKQEAGRVSEKELSLSRANRSVRLWDYVVDALSRGVQPDLEKVEAVGYLMRTTAVYGSGKFGAADREQSANRPECQGPFQIEMLSVFLTRAFVMDLVEYMAKLRAPETAVTLDPALRRRFGIGNSTGLGMAPFLLNHPALISNWIHAREEALARIRSLPTASEEDAQAFRDFAARAQLHSNYWTSEHPVQVEKLSDLRADMEALRAHLETADLMGDHPWNRLWLWAEGALSLEGQEQLASLLMEPYGDLVDGLSDCMSADEARFYRIDGSMSVSRLKALIEDIYAWALETDWTDPAAQARVWYVSEEKLEPRMGERFEEPIEPYEQPLCPGRDAARMYADLKDFDDGPIAAFLLRHPEHRHVVRRAQIAAKHPYAEIRDNTISASVMPIDLLRAKLSFFGACHFDPRSDRWVRINMFQHAPFPHELATGNADDWTYPYLKGSEG